MQLGNRAGLALRAACGALLLAAIPSAAQYPTVALPAAPDTASTAVDATRLHRPGRPFALPQRSFLHRDNGSGYLNYGVEPYETYTVSSKSFQIYDRLGNRVLRGYPLMSWEENRTGDSADQSSRIVRAEEYRFWFDNLLVSKDGYRDWDFSILAGDRIRTALTPLTFSQPRWDGVRIDAQSPVHGLTILMSRGQERRFSAFQAREEANPVLQYGGRWHAKIGDWLRVGTTFFNQHLTDLQAQRGDLIHGTLQAGMEAPSAIFVRVQDDSPADGTPALVYGVDIHLRVVRADGSREWLTSAASATGGYLPALEPVVVAGQRHGDRYEARGPIEAVDFEFSIPQGLAIEKARFEAAVAGDYRISVRQKHAFFNVDARTPAWEERQWPARPLPTLHNQDGFPSYPIDYKPAEEESYFTLVRSAGNSTSTAPRTVSFDYGIPVGQTLAGTDFEILADVLVARGELVFNVQDQQFPFHSDSLGVVGRRFSRRALAGYLTLEKKLGPRLRHAEIGLELFRLDPDYSGGYESRRGGAVLFTDKDGDFQVVRTSRIFSGFTQEFHLVADNDDGDDWEDDSPAEEGNFQPLQPQVYSGAKAHSGVFPGLDDDGDNTPDSDRNRNGIADWSEPFLFYESDPQDFVYGIDFNNNGVPDFRENDAEPDYPYRRDTEGFHAFAAVPLSAPLNARLSAGYFSLSQMAGGGRSRGPYARFQHRSRWRALAIALADDIKYVRDTIADDVYTFDIRPGARNSGSVLNPPPPDPLTMKRSVVNTAYLRLAPDLGRDAHADVRLLHVLNQQLDAELPDGTLQEARRLNRFTAVARADYAARWAGVDVWLGIKQMFREGRGEADGTRSSIRFRAPALRLSFPFMSGVFLRAGLSGLPGLPMRFEDRKAAARSFAQETTVLSIDTRVDDYLGYTLFTSAGVRWDRIDFDQGDRSVDSDIFGFFVESFAGF